MALHGRLQALITPPGSNCTSSAQKRPKAAPAIAFIRKQAALGSMVLLTAVKRAQVRMCLEQPSLAQPPHRYCERSPNNK